MTEPDGRIVLDRKRVEAILKLLERMASGNVADLYVVRQYIDGQRG